MFIPPTARARNGRKAPARAARTPSGARGAAAFTLIEVIVGMALLVFVIGGVYSVANGAIGLSTSIGHARVYEARVTNFVGQWREFLETLPPGTRFSADGDEMLFEGGNVPFAWTRAVRRADAVEFSVRKNADGGAFVVTHLKRPERPTSADDYRVIADLPILIGLRECKWEFFEPVEKKWHRSWDAEKHPQPPLFMRLRFALAEQPAAYEFIFWMANDLVAPQQQSQQPQASTLDAREGRAA